MAKRLHLADASSTQHNSTQQRSTCKYIVISVGEEKKIVQKYKFSERGLFVISTESQSKCIFSRVLTLSVPAMELNPWQQHKVLRIECVNKRHKQRIAFSVSLGFPFWRFVIKMEMDPIRSGSVVHSPLCTHEMHFCAQAGPIHV